MDTLKRKVNNRNQVYKIYTAEEADKLNITYLHWKEAHIGDYALSDDGYVGKCIGRKTYTDKKVGLRRSLNFPMVQTGREIPTR